MPDTKTEMKSKHIPVVCTKAMEQFLSVSPGRDLISLRLKPFRVFICTLAPEVYELIWMLIKCCKFPQTVFLGHMSVLHVFFFPKDLSILIKRLLWLSDERMQISAEGEGTPESTFVN